MSAGELDRRITIRRAVLTPGDFNEPVPVWSDLVTVWASVRDVTDVEQLRAQEVGASVSTRFKIRWSSDVANVDPRDRIAYGGREYDITGVRELGRRRWLEISAVARAETP